MVYTEERLRHIIKEHHLTDEELDDDIGAHINDLYDVRLSAWKKGEYAGQYQGNAVLAKVHGSIGNYEVVLEVRPDGQVFFDTAYKVNKKAEETGAEMLSPEGAVSDGRQISSASIQSIRERFGKIRTRQFIWIFFFTKIKRSRKASALSSFIENSLPQILPQSG